MADPVTWVAIASVASAATGAYSAVEQNKQAKKAARQQEEALKKQEEEALKKGPQATTMNEEDSSIEAARKRLLQRGFLSTLKTGETGLGTAAETAGTGLKGTLG